MEILTGRRFGRWTVLEEWSGDCGRNYRWKCRCDCGTERMVLARSLKSGASLSCGCLKSERVKAKAKDLTGQRFGYLTVVQKQENSSGTCTRWLCRCDCGRECEVSSTRLVTGKKQHCGCRTRRDFNKKDITGQKFRMLTALYETDKRDRKDSVIWHCRCDCGNEVDVSYNDLKYCNIVSCGCKKKEAERKLHQYLTHVAGTSVDILKSDKLRKNNNTGVTGVFFTRDKYRAEICFQRRKFRLGTYETLEAAAAIRKEAEQILHKDFLQFYEKWQEKAAADPEWGKENPIAVEVKKDEYGELCVEMIPRIK